MSIIDFMLTGTCDIYRRSESQATGGEPRATYAVTASSVRCSVQANSSRNDFVQKSQGGTVTFTVFLPSGTSVLFNDLIKPTSGYHSGKTLWVSGGPFDAAGEGDHVVVPCEERKGTSPV